MKTKLITLCVSTWDFKKWGKYIFQGLHSFLILKNEGGKLEI